MSPLLRYQTTWLLLALLLGQLPLRAQTVRLAASRRYWEANPDSLRRVLAGPLTDTARLRTLRHLADVSIDALSPEAYGQFLPELAALTSRLRTPDRHAYRLLQAASRLLAHTPPQRAALDSLQAAVAEFDQLGQPAFAALNFLSAAYLALNQSAARRPYYHAKLLAYQRRNDPLDEAICCLIVGGTYYRQGNYDQAIGYYLQAAALLRARIPPLYRNALVAAGDSYVEWGSYERGIQYFQQFLALATRLPADQDLVGFVNQDLATIYLRQHRYPLALRYINRALALGRASGVPAAFSQATGLVIKSAILLAQGQVAAAGQLLPVAQHLADSLRLPLSGGTGLVELDATWARYYAAHHEPARAEAAWLTAYRKAQATHSLPLRLVYLRELGRFYQQQGQPARAAPYALAAATLADSLEAAQGARHVARYEVAQADRAQQARLTGLRLAQVQAAARTRRQRLLLGATLVVLALVAGLGYVLWRSNRRQRQANQALSQLNAAVTTQKQALQAQRDQLDTSLTELRTTQQQLIQKEKMASLGELTAGIAHEIQNPLNFVNNFAQVSAELLLEVKEAQAVGDAAEAAALTDDVIQNLTKISQHGQRAAGIVRGMLAHSRQSSGERQPTDVNQLADEYLRLAYHGLRAKDKSFNAELPTSFAPRLPLLEAVPGDLGRVLLNLFTNAFYAVQQRQRTGEPGYVPTVSVQTRQVGKQVEIQVQDNGTGMSPEVQAKVFQPFFTTKPTGEGTGLGLSLSHTIITKGHGGALTVASTPGQGSIFTIGLPTSSRAGAATKPG